MKHRIVTGFGFLGLTLAVVPFSVSESRAEGALAATELVWDIIKDGGEVSTSSTKVHAIKEGTSVRDYDWKPETAVYEERFHLTTWLGFDAVDFTVRINWRYDGTYIGNFTVDASGFADIMEKVDISVETLDATIQNGVVELPYRIRFKARNRIAGTTMETYAGVAYGDGGGRGGW
jgi:hypothetical protein